MAAAPDMTPPAAAQEFLRARDWHGAVISPLAGDASFRRYFRVTHPHRGSAVLMDAPPPHEDARPFLAVADWLSAQGFHPPAVLARDEERGLVLLQDLGDRRMREHLDRHPQEEQAIYAAAVDELIRLHRAPAPDLPAYGLADYLREVRLLPEWFAPAAGLAVDAAGYEVLWADLLAPVLAEQEARPVAVLRDYHAENIMLLPDGRLGLLDFQDALVGHPAYDLVSLLKDARRAVCPDVEARMLDRYCAATGAGEDFRRAYRLLGAQRNAKIVGIFTRLWRRDAKPRYLAYLPRMWRLIEADLDAPELQPFARWLADNIPARARGALSAD